MRRTWTISLPQAMSQQALQVARQEHRTKSELIREALRCYFAQRGRRPPAPAATPLDRVGELAEFYEARHRRSRSTEAELRDACRGVRLMHERLQHVVP